MIAITLFLLCVSRIRAQCSLSATYEHQSFQSLTASGITTLQETEVFEIVNCEWTITATAAATIGGTVFPADILTYTVPTDSIITFHYPGVTLSTISSGEIVIIASNSSAPYLTELVAPRIWLRYRH
jgi:hypothetical protein